MNIGRCACTYQVSHVTMKHIRTRTRLRSSYKCNRCEYSSNKVFDLKSLQELWHYGDKAYDDHPYECKTSTSLRSHKQTYSPIKCDECKDSCLKSTQLKIHYTIHSGEKSCICKICVD